MGRSAVSLWGLRLAWIVTGATAWGQIDALDAVAATDRTVLQVAIAVGWLAGVVAIAIVSTAGLTTARAVIPLSAPTAVALMLATAISAGSIALLVAALTSSMIVLSAGFGAASVQASAYGDEVRCLLRPPVGYLIVATVVALVWAALAVGAGLALGSGRRPLAIGLAAVALVLVVVAWPRWHRLSRRWLVLVPAGLVVHDPIVLADTIMLRRSAIGGIALAPTDTSAVDLSGPAPGHLIEIRATAPQPVATAATRRGEAPTGHEITAFLIAPTRPGRALEHCRDRRLPVGF